MGQIRVILDDCNGPLNLVRHRQQNGLVTKPCQRAGVTDDTIQKGIAREGAMSQSRYQRAGATDCARSSRRLAEASHKALSAGRCDGLEDMLETIKELLASQSPVSGQVRRTD